MNRVYPMHGFGHLQALQDKGPPRHFSELLRPNQSNQFGAMHSVRQLLQDEVETLH